LQPTSTDHPQWVRKLYVPVTPSPIGMLGSLVRTGLGGVTWRCGNPPTGTVPPGFSHWYPRKTSALGGFCSWARRAVEDMRTKAKLKNRSFDTTGLRLLRQS